MNRDSLIFDRPDALTATKPSEYRGIERDKVRLMVTTPSGHTHAHFHDLPNFLDDGDVLVVNRSATLPASLPATGRLGDFTLNLSTAYGKQLWLAEPRWSPAQPGPLPVIAGDEICVGGVKGRLIVPYPGIDRLWFIQFSGDPQLAMQHVGQPIRYGYVEGQYPLAMYQTIFADTPGSAEMPSAAYPFTSKVVAGLLERGVQIVDITLHTGVSSLEVEVEQIEDHPLYPEPFAVPKQTAQIINQACLDGRRIIAVGTTVVRALESAWDGEMVVSSSGFTRLYIRPDNGIHVIDGLITGMHDPVTSHLAMLYAIAGEATIRDAYEEAVQMGYLWHEFGDSHLILTRN